MKKIQFLLVLAISIVSMVGFSNALSLEAVMPIINGWSASEATNGVKVVKDGDNYYICNSGNLSNCNKKNASTWVKYEKGLNRGDKYYICNASSSSCSAISHSSIIYQYHETMEFDGYYLCNSSSCSFTDSNTKINKDSGYSYYVCQGEKYKCGKNNASYKYSTTTDKIYKCNANVSSCDSSNATTTINKKTVSSSSSSSSSNSLNSNTDFSWLVADLEEELAYMNKANSYYAKGLNAAMADDYKTAITNQAEVVKIYKSLYKTNKDYKDVLANSYANLGYYLCLNKNYSQAEQAYQASLDLINDPEVRADMKNCKEESNSQTSKSNNTASNNTTLSNNTTTLSNNTNNGSSKLYNNEYSDEYNKAYEYAYANKITTMPTIEQANMHGYITRAEISKMFSEWALKHGAIIDTSKSCKFNDISSVKGDLHDYIIKSCQLGIMGQGIKNFRPYDTISRAEVFTVISRILRGNTYEGCDPYYSCHESAIARAGIYSDMRESDRIREFRGNVMMYLMRGDGVGESNSSYDNVIEYNDKIIDYVSSCDDSVVNSLLDEEPLDIDALEKAAKDILNLCKKSYEQLESLGGWNGDSSFNDGAIYFVKVKAAFYKIFKDTIPYIGRELSDVEDKQYTELSKKLDKLDEMLNDASDNLIVIQEKFAKKFGYDLEN